MIAFQGTVPRSGPAPAKSAAVVDSRSNTGAQPAAVPNAPLPGAIVTYALYFDTAFVGYARSLDGCTMAFDVVATLKGGGKELGKGPHVEPCVIGHSMMPNAFESWVVHQVNNSAIFNPDSLGIVGIDSLGNPAAALRLKRPLLIGFVVPAADATAIRTEYFQSTIDGTLVESVKPSIYPSPSWRKRPEGPDGGRLLILRRWCCRSVREAGLRYRARPDRPRPRQSRTVGRFERRRPDGAVEAGTVREMVVERPWRPERHTRALGDAPVPVPDPHAALPDRSERSGAVSGRLGPA